MFLACGVGAFVAAIFHVMTHAFFKALLFLGSGSVIHGMHHEQDMRRMGNLKKFMPITFITMMAGWLAICGIPIWAGFFSKDEILYKTFAATNATADATLAGIHVNTILWIVGLVTAMLTAIYMTRMMWMTFFGAERFHEALPIAENPHESSRAEENAFAFGDAHDAKEPHGDAHALAFQHDDHDLHGHGDLAHDDHDDEHHHALAPDFRPHESPWTMTVPLVVLAILSTLGGLIGVPYAMSSMFGAGDVNVFEHTLAPIIYAKKADSHSPASTHSEPKKEVKHFYAASAPAPNATGGHTEEHTAHSPEEIATERWLALLSVGLAVAGIVIGIAMFGKTPLRAMPKILEDKWRIDEIYNGFIVDPLTRLSRNGLWRGFDVGFIDGIVNGIGHSVTALGSAARSVQVGFVRSYAAFILFGALLVIGYFIYYGFKLVG
jgi:NADH-quinone oxidoreductase subunit L